MLLAFEEAEALRYVEYLKPGGAAVVNQHIIKPITVTSGGARYPTEAELQAVYGVLTERLHVVSGTAVAPRLWQRAGSQRGAHRRAVDLSRITWGDLAEGLEARVPPRYAELNRQAFLRGRRRVGERES